MQSFVKLFNFNPYGKIIFTKHMRDWRFSQYLLKIGIWNSTKFEMNMCEAAYCVYKKVNKCQSMLIDVNRESSGKR